MQPRERMVALVVGLVGLAGSLAALGVFIWVVRFNHLGWTPDQTVREYYIEIGRWYSRGFATGFSFCFSLVLVALAARAIREALRKRRADRNVSWPAPGAAGSPAPPHRARTGS